MPSRICVIRDCCPPARVSEPGSRHRRTTGGKAIRSVPLRISSNSRARPKCGSRIAKTSRPVAVSRSNSAAGRGGDGIISEGPRFHVPAETAFCWTEVYLDGRLAPIVRPIDVLRTAVFVMVEDQAGEPIVEIRQDIHPCVIDAAKAPILGSKVGDLALQITR